MQAILEQIWRESLPAAAAGKLASYIPALTQADPASLGLAITTRDGQSFTAGAAERKFTVQSISKVLALAYVIAERGTATVFSRVGKEPTGDPFNSIIRLETSARRKPFNPFINAGAIVVSGLMPGASTGQRIEGFCDFVAALVGAQAVVLDAAVYQSEKTTAARNRAIAWFLKELSLIEGDVEETLDVYFRQCAVLLDAVQLSRIGAILALDGFDPVLQRQMLATGQARLIKSLMITCGLYDGSGEFAFDVGIPAKSGVGGGILATVRDRLGIGVYGPALDERGNSCAGLEALRRLSDRLDLRVL
ncbi:MAG: glutaminase A [Spirochaetes bacterium GWD1_61_31]|nr:MAG: glutaminase A [Spirochaetes bacterium GWB1_60_80]OHD28593.1 MAG: glutaminase A [Spirochaetes bacterium GWC1_61_12]OHD37603.1 MAG: glutaminase A [Spirochaetes bacterium GWD1_61_31]OHD44341.1 MAG: glutaminase A [Spirochaetes bacterium GWE1_60_18]OHD61015.1 MAG: glutaminase A [Spirochaetes bacterium GWF1_60_12]HAP44759.1 glutaminase A [Spirochaetaceae bacterium]